jgi:hypothetical protein
MKVQNCGRRLLLATIVLISSTFSPIWAEIIDRVLAVVDGVLITQSDATAASTLGLVHSDAAGDLAAVLSELIDRQLILAEVDRYAPPEPTAEARTEAMQALKGRFASSVSYDATLVRLGLDEQYVRRIVRDNLRMQAYLDQRFAVSPPTDEEVSRYYQEHPETFTRAGVALPLEQARAEIVRALATARREMLVREWVAGLRRRANVTDLSLPRR